MSHELRTPLNSLLLLSQGLSDNAQGNLTGRQVEISKTIHASGSDLLELINDILDLAKIESGTVAVDADQVFFGKLHDFVERSFRQLAEKKGIEFRIEMASDLPESLETGGKRLQQILRNLLSNAFKFTERGEVVLRMSSAAGGWNRDNAGLNTARAVIEFSVRDTGIGIPKDKHALIFEAFQQADGTTSRKYGGTGWAARSGSTAIPASGAPSRSTCPSTSPACGTATGASSLRRSRSAPSRARASSPSASRSCRFPAPALRRPGSRAGACCWE